MCFCSLKENVRPSYDRYRAPCTRCVRTPDNSDVQHLKHSHNPQRLLLVHNISIVGPRKHQDRRPPAPLLKRFCIALLSLSLVPHAQPTGIPPPFPIFAERPPNVLCARRLHSSAGVADGSPPHPLPAAVRTVRARRLPRHPLPVHQVEPPSQVSKGVLPV